MNKTGISLVLEGGGMRGNYTAGVLDFFLQKNLNFDYIIGVSAGACNATSFISKQIYRNAKILYHYADDKNYMSLYNYWNTGSYLGMNMIFDEIPNKLEPFDYEAFCKYNKNFIVVVTNCNTGLPEYRRITDMNETDLAYMKATVSLPYISKMVGIEGKQFLDGGISDSIPIKKSIADGNQKHIVILTRDRYYRKKKSSNTKYINQRFYGKYPELCKAIENRPVLYNNTLELLHYLERKNQCFLLQPEKPIFVRRLEKNADKLLDLYRLGYIDAAKNYRRLLNYLNL